MEEVKQLATVAHADVHVALVAHDRQHERLDVLLGDVVHVAVDEEEDVVRGVVDADPHRVPLPLILAKGHDPDAVKRPGDLDRAVGRPVADDDHLVDQRTRGQRPTNIGDGRFLVVRGNDG